MLIITSNNHAYEWLALNQMSRRL